MFYRSINTPRATNGRVVALNHLSDSKTVFFIRQTAEIELIFFSIYQIYLSLTWSPKSWLEIGSIGFERKLHNWFWLRKLAKSCLLLLRVFSNVMMNWTCDVIAVVIQCHKSVEWELSFYYRNCFRSTRSGRRFTRLSTWDSQTHCKSLSTSFCQIIRHRIWVVVIETQVIVKEWDLFCFSSKIY